jgi:Transposase DDE domain group 1
LRVTAVNGGRRRGRIVIGENDPSLVRYAGLVVTGELARRLRLVELIDAELSVERRARPVKVRRPGLSPGQLVVALSECQLIGGEFFADLEEVRADQAGSGLRTVGQTPSAPTALQRAKDFRRVHCQRVERACARVGEHLDRALGRELTEPVTIDLDATVIEVYGARKQGAARNRVGQLSYAPHVAFWAQRGRALTSELVGGNREKLTGAECARIATRALSLLPAGHGPATFRIDSAYYQLELLSRLRRERARFTVSVPRSQAMWKALAEIGEDAWQDALDMQGSRRACDDLRFRCRLRNFRRFTSARPTRQALLERLPDPHLTRSSAPFPCRSPRRSSTNAAQGGLAPAPEGRRRRASNPPSLAQLRPWEGSSTYLLPQRS